MLINDTNYDETERFLSEDESEQKYMDESVAAYNEKHKHMTHEQLITRHEETHGKTAKWQKIARYEVKPHQKMTDETKKVLGRLIASAEDEGELQRFIEKHKYILTGKASPAHHGQICIPKPNLGGKLHPDFLIAGLDSAGFWWYGVELENPRYRMFTKKADPTKELSHALRQIEDWRSWLTQNISYAQDELGFLQIDADLPCYIVIGRRNNEVLDAETLQKRQRAVMKRDKDQLLLHHYEWFLDDYPTLVEGKRSATEIVNNDVLPY